MFTITAEDIAPKTKRWIRPGANSLRTDDIEGASPHLPGYTYHNKPNFYNVNDIEKALIFMYLEDKDYTEIAETLGISEVNARVKMNRIKGKLKKILNP